MSGFQLHLKGNPLLGLRGYEVAAAIGDSLPLGDAGAWGTQFKYGDSFEAVRLWGMSEEELAALRRLVGDDPQTEESASKSAALELLLGQSVKFAMQMLIEWLGNHPDANVRLCLIGLLSSRHRGSPMFEGIR